MGTKMAPTYATLFLGHLEQILYTKLEAKYGNEFSNYIKKNWKRFLDDCIILWNSNISLEDFQNDLNELDSNIKFTMERSKSNLPFLDVMIKIHGNKITTDVYSKPTDTHMYLNFNSCHPKHIKINIPFNLASRILAIANTEESKSSRLQQLKTDLKKQNYPEKLIEFGIQRALENQPTNTNVEEQTSNTNNEYDIIPFVTTHNPRNYDIFGFFKHIDNNLYQSEKMKNILQKKKIINSKRQPKNLKRILSTSKFDLNDSSPSVRKCTDKRCLTCKTIIDRSTYIFKNGKHFTVKQELSCTSKNVIYSIICRKCGDFYIGETKTELRTRMTVHRQQTNHEELTILSVNRHFRHCSGGDFMIFPLYKVNSTDDLLRKQKEKLFINILKPNLNDK